MSSTIFGLLLCTISYLLGSIPFGLIFSKLFSTADPRTAGSGNIGFTNVLRLSGKKVGVLTLLGDFGKGLLVGWASLTIYSTGFWSLIATFFVVLGHIFPIFLGFRGGKGVATGLGAILGLNPMLGGIMIGFWVGAVGIWRYSSGGALTAFAALPVLSLMLGQPVEFTVMSIAISTMVFFKHSENNTRLWNGTESRVGFSSS